MVYKRTSVCPNNSTTLAAAWTLSSETMVPATLDAASDRSVFNAVINDEPGCTNACIGHRHIGPSPGLMVWGAIGYMSRSPLVRIDDTLNSAFLVLRPWLCPGYAKCSAVALVCKFT
ncbi:hypothetical protein TNCV_1010551 [Trichonephila clavipes]|nr:hypothetical protein TNCV_1010551 [Trichonephila clavipes]